MYRLMKQYRNTMIIISIQLCVCKCTENQILADCIMNLYLVRLPFMSSIVLSYLNLCSSQA